VSGARPQRLAFLGIGLAATATAGLLAVRLLSVPLPGPWTGVQGLGVFFGLRPTDAAIGAALLLALAFLTLNSAERPQLAAGAWMLAGLILALAAAASAGQLISPFVSDVVLDSAGRWWSLPAGGNALLAALSGLQCIAAILLVLAAGRLLGRTAEAGVAIRGRRLLLRCFLALPLTVGIIGSCVAAVWTLAWLGRRPSADLSAIAFELGAVLVYGAAALLLLSGLSLRRGRLAVFAAGAAYIIVFFDHSWQHGAWHIALMLYAMAAVVMPLARRPAGDVRPDDDSGRREALAVAKARNE